MNANKTVRLSEGALRDAGYEWECCDSCHDDDEMGYEMTERESYPPIEGVTYWLTCCCATPTPDEAGWLRAVATLP